MEFSGPKNGQTSDAHIHTCCIKIFYLSICLSQFDKLSGYFPICFAREALFVEFEVRRIKATERSSIHQSSPSLFDVLVACSCFLIHFPLLHSFIRTRVLSGKQRVRDEVEAKRHSFLFFLFCFLFVVAMSAKQKTQCILFPQHGAIVLVRSLRPSEHAFLTLYVDCSHLSLIHRIPRTKDL